MSFLDKAKEAAAKAAAQAQEVAGKAQDYAADHKEQLADAASKGGDLVNKGTKGRFAKQVDTVSGKAAEAARRLEKR